MEITQIPAARAIAKGSLSIIGVTKTRHVEDAVKAMGITLTKEEPEELEKRQTVSLLIPSAYGRKR